MARPAAVPLKNVRAGSLLVLVAGLALVFAGLSAALDFSIAGMAASGAVIAALLYAGGVWFGAPRERLDQQVVLFTRQLKVASGPSAGRAVSELFPPAMAAVIEEACRQALDGQSRRFAPDPGHAFIVSPIRSPEGVVVYGVLLSGQLTDAAASDLMPV